MRALLLLLLLCASVAFAKEEARPFQPTDRSFRVMVPGNVRSVSQQDGQFLWGVDNGRTSYVFGYTFLERAASLGEEELRVGLDQFASGYAQNAQIRIKTRLPGKVLNHPSLDVKGSGKYGDSWARIVAVGPRIYILASDGTSEQDNHAYWSSFKLLQ